MGPFGEQSAPGALRPGSERTPSQPTGGVCHPEFQAEETDAHVVMPLPKDFR